MIKIKKLFYSPFKSMNMVEINQIKLNKKFGIENDRVFCFTRFLDEKEALFFQNNRKSRNIINYLSMKHSAVLNQYDFQILKKEISLFKSEKKLITIQNTSFSDLQKIVYAFKKEESLEKDKIFLLHNTKNPFFDYMRENTISLINLESLNNFNQKTKCNIDLERFRANIYIDGLEPFDELKWIGKKIIISKKEFEVFNSIPRCKATHYPYKSTIADVNVPYLLKQNYGHINMGIYLRPTSSASISLDSSIISSHVR